MNILIEGMTSNKGGVESVIMNYLKDFHDDTLNFIFVCHGDKEIAYYEDIKKMNGKIIYVTSKRKNILKNKHDIKNIFKNNKIDVVWSNQCSLSNINVLKYAKKFKVKKRIIHSHNSSYMGDFISKTLHKINRFFIKKYANYFWACSENAARFFYRKKITREKKFTIINNAIDLNKFAHQKENYVVKRKELKVKDGDLIVGHVGRFHFQKNHPFLIRVFNEMLKINGNLKLVLIGEGPEQDNIKDMVKSLGIDENVMFLGPRNDVPELLNAMDIFLFPSNFEGLSVALLEAQATGLTVYTSANVISDTKVTDNYYSLSLNEDPKVWAEYIFNTYDKNYDRKQNVEQVRNAGFDISIEANKLLEFFKSED